MSRSSMIHGGLEGREETVAHPLISAIKVPLRTSMGSVSKRFGVTFGLLRFLNPHPRPIERGSAGPTDFLTPSIFTSVRDGTTILGGRK